MITIIDDNCNSSSSSSSSSSSGSGSSSNNDNDNNDNTRSRLPPTSGHGGAAPASRGSRRKIASYYVTLNHIVLCYSTL